MIMGQASGVAAALAIKEDSVVQNVDIPTLQGKFHMIKILVIYNINSF